MSDFVPPSGYDPDKPMIQVDYSSHLSVEEKRLIIMWHCNDDLPIWSSNPRRDTCHKRIRRVRKQTVYNVIHDWLAYGYIRQRGHNRVVNHRDGHFLDAHWPTLERIITDTPWLYLDELRKKVNEICGTQHKDGVIERAMLSHDYSWKKITRMAKERDHVDRRKYHNLIQKVKPWQIYFFDESHTDELSGRRRRSSALLRIE